MWQRTAHRSGFVLTLAVFAFTLAPPPRNFPVYQCSEQDRVLLSFSGADTGGAHVKESTLRILDGALVLVYTSTALSLAVLVWGCDSRKCNGGIFWGLLSSTLASHIACLAFLIVPGVIEGCELSSAPAAELLNVVYWIYVCICFSNLSIDNTKNIEGGATAPLLLFF